MRFCHPLLVLLVVTFSLKDISKTLANALPLVVRGGAAQTKIAKYHVCLGSLYLRTSGLDHCMLLQVFNAVL